MYLMMKHHILVILLLTVSLLLLSKTAECYSVTKYSLLMPNVKPNVPELYLCTPVKINATESYYIVGFEPNATMNTAHHMLIYGCTEPGTAKDVWDCGEMSSNSGKEDAAAPCSLGSEMQGSWDVGIVELNDTDSLSIERRLIMYAWARDAPKLLLPEGVGFKVGSDSPIKYLVLQVHYAHIDHFKDGRTDDSGVFLHYTKKKLNKLAGVFLLGTGGMIPPRSTEKMETACTLQEKQTIHPFAYRIHTHSLGKVVSGYRIRDNQWIELGKGDPMKPQMFYPIHNNVSITRGDTLAARCTMLSNRNRWTYIGATNADEMCNFYLMYYVDKGEPLKRKYCFTSGPPQFRWESAGLVNIPEIEASSL